MAANIPALAVCLFQFDHQHIFGRSSLGHLGILVFLVGRHIIGRQFENIVLMVYHLEPFYKY